MAESTTALATRPAESLASVAKAMVGSKFFSDIKTAEQAMVKLKLGEALGIDPLTAMSQIFFQNGKPCMTASLQARLIKQSGKYRYEVLEKNNKICKLQFFELITETNDSGKKIQKWKSVGVEEFGEEDAKLAGLMTGPNAQNYKKYPKGMYFARALTNGFRTYCPDAIQGGGTIYLPEELGDNVKVDYSSGDGVVVEVDGEIITEDKSRRQVMQILITETQSNVEKLQDYFGVATLDALTTKQVEDAIKLLEVKKNAK